VLLALLAQMEQRALQDQQALMAQQDYKVQQEMMELPVQLVQ